MSTTVQEIYQRVSWDLLENSGLVLGTVTPAQFLDYLAEAILEFCQGAGLVRKIFTQQIFMGQTQYLAPDDILLIQHCFVGGKYIDPTTLEELQNSEYEWPKQSGPPRAWFQDGQPESEIQLFPNPIYTGTAIAGSTPPIGNYDTFAPEENNLTIVGSAGPTTIAVDLTGNIPPEVPDSFTPYLGYRVLQRIFSTDGEAKDTQRAIYCGARWQEGISLAAAIRGEALMDEKVAK